MINVDCNIFFVKITNATLNTVKVEHEYCILQKPLYFACNLIHVEIKRKHINKEQCSRDF